MHPTLRGGNTQPPDGDESKAGALQRFSKGCKELHSEATRRENLVSLLVQSR